MNRSTPGLPVHHQLPEFTQLMCIESVMPSNHLILCRPLLLLPPILPIIRVFSNESTLHMKWLKYWSFIFNISLSSEHPGHIFNHFPQFVVIHTGKGFSIVNEEEVDVLIEFPCFFYNLMGVGNLISDSSAFSESSLNIWTFLVHVLLKPCLENFHEMGIPDHLTCLLIQVKTLYRSRTNS